jgi:hypothetical protein
MQKKALCGLVLASFLAVFSTSAFGWNEVGHKITAYIAWQRMAPDVRERLIKLLREAPEDSQIATFYFSYGSQSRETRERDFFMLISTWADMIKDRDFPTRNHRYNHSNWHYTDTPWTMKDGKIEILPTAADGGLALERIKEFDGTIRGTASDAQKAVAIAWLLHLIGDIHQPLHVSARVTDLEPKGDQGANLFLLTPAGTPKAQQKNLHSFWDSIIEENDPNSKDLCDADYVIPNAEKIMKMFPFTKLQGELLPAKFEDWARESLMLAQTEVYSPDLKRNEPPPARYRKKALKIAQRRMALGGYRLGELFNEVFATAK